MSGGKREALKAWRIQMPRLEKGCREVSVKCRLIA
jgi:hypothetical protein